MNRDFKGIWIPREIWLHKGLTRAEKDLWAELHSLYDREKGGCFASNEYLAEFLGVSERYIREMISKLKKLGLVKDVSFDGRTRVIMAVMPPEDFGECHAERNYSSGQGGTTVPVSPEPQFREGTPSPYIHSNKEENKDKYIAQPSCVRSATPPHTSKVPVISFSFDKNKFENISQEDIKTWEQLYPATDVKRELIDMVEWIKANPSKAKSKRRWHQFIRGWLQRQNEKLTNRLAYQNLKDKQVLSRHTGFQKDDRPQNPKRVIDLREEK